MTRDDERLWAEAVTIEATRARAIEAALLEASESTIYVLESLDVREACTLMGLSDWAVRS